MGGCMLKRFICGAFTVAALCGSGVGPAQADELYVRNRPFKDAYFIGGTTYVPVDGFLKAVKTTWDVDGTTVTVGEGNSPQLSENSETITIVQGGRSRELSGILRAGRLYVPAKGLAEVVGYNVIYNRATGVVDVVKARFVTESDEKAAAEVVAARQAEQEKRDAAWKARVEKARAERKAKADAIEDTDPSDEDTSDSTVDPSDETGPVADDALDMTQSRKDEDSDVSDTTPQKIDGKDDREADMKDRSTDLEEDEIKKTAPPLKAELVVLGADANPNNYTGDVVISATLQNQGYADATNIKAQLIVVGPDGKQWINKTLHHADIKPDGQWSITENYRHRLKGAIPGGAYDVQVIPTYDSAAPKE